MLSLSPPPTPLSLCACVRACAHVVCVLVRPRSCVRACVRERAGSGVRNELFDDLAQDCSSLTPAPTTTSNLSLVSLKTLQEGTAQREIGGAAKPQPAGPVTRTAGVFHHRTHANISLRERRSRLKKNNNNKNSPPHPFYLFFIFYYYSPPPPPPLTAPPPSSPSSLMFTPPPFLPCAFQKRSQINSFQTNQTWAHIHVTWQIDKGFSLLSLEFRQKNQSSYDRPRMPATGTQMRNGTKNFHNN